MKKLSSVVISLAMVLVGTGCNQQKNLAVVSGQQDGHDYVDLGLPSGTQWATLNVGANQPEENGSYFAWGETAPKHTYEWSNYKYGNGGTDSKIKVNKYNSKRLIY